MKKLILPFVLTATSFFFSCSSNLKDEDIRLEKETGKNFLNAIKQRDYEHAIDFLSKNALSGERTPDDFKNGMKQIEDSFGAIENFELIQLKSHNEIKTGQADVSTRKYIYVVNFKKDSSLLQFDLVFDIEPEDKVTNKERKIDFMAIDIYNDNK